MKNTLLIVLGYTLIGVSLGAQAGDFRMQIKDIMRLSGQGIIMTGKIADGQISNGDSICVPLIGGGKAGRQVKGIEKLSKVVTSAGAGEHVGLLVGELTEDEVAKGEVLVSGC